MPQAVTVETVLQVAVMARRVGATKQLLPFAVYFATYHHEVLAAYHKHLLLSLQQQQPPPQAPPSAAAEVAWLTGLVQAELGRPGTLLPVVTRASPPFSDGSYDHDNNR